MSDNPARWRTGYLLAAAWWPALVAGAQWSGSATTEYRWFSQEPLDSRQHEGNMAFAFEPEFYQEWNDGDQSVTFTPFVRLDQHDAQRRHLDIRELNWVYVARNWEARVGISKVFWGVTEAQHLVDVINQTDLVERPDGEAKLGQPMIDVSWVQNWGTVDLLFLPYFRERTFPGPAGRLRTPVPVDSDRAEYESPDREHHLDVALRWSHSVNVFDIGVSYFDGTNREPGFIPATGADGGPLLIPYYALMQQTGLDLQATVEAWLWKLEAIYRKQRNDAFFAATGGFEYTFFGVFDSPADLGVVVEYLYDDRAVDPTLGLRTTPFQDDVLLAVRWQANDEDDTQALLGVIVDNDTRSQTYSLEASRRLSDHWTFSIDARWFTGIEPQELLYGFRNDDFLEFRWAYYF